MSDRAGDDVDEAAPWRAGTTRTGSLAHIFPRSFRSRMSICGQGQLDEGRSAEGLPMCPKCEQRERCAHCTALGPYAVEHGWWHDRGCPLFKETDATDG